LKRKEPNDSPTMSKYQQKKAKQKNKKNAKAQAKRQNSKTDTPNKDDQDAETMDCAEVAKDDEEVAQLTDEFTSKLDVMDNVQNGCNDGSSNVVVADSTAADIDAQFEDADESKLSASEDSGVVDVVELGSEVEKEPSDFMETDDRASSGVETLSTITLESGFGRMDSTLTNCLRQFTAVELLNGKNKFGCENCAKLDSSAARTPNSASISNGSSTHSEEPTKRNRKDSSNPVVYTDAEKRYLIYSPPAVLTLHLKRFHQTGIGMRKINKHVEFSPLLDVGSYCCKNGQRFSSNQGKVVYSLYGIVSHSGGLSGGHYVAYVKVRPKNLELSVRFLQNILNDRNVSPSSNELNRNGVASIENGKEAVDADFAIHPSENGTENLECPPTPAPGKWYYISDTHVSEVQESRVLSSEAYLLFYERIF